MCYTLTLSTDSPEDLAKFNDGHLFFEKTNTSHTANPLRYAHQYEIATMQKGNCSCHLRVFDEDLSKEMGFCALQDWLDEKEDADVLATRRLFEILKSLVNQGYKVDSLMLWNDETPAHIKNIPVPVNEVEVSHFAFFENTHFEYINTF